MYKCRLLVACFNNVILVINKYYIYSYNDNQINSLAARASAPLLIRSTSVPLISAPQATALNGGPIG